MNERKFDGPLPDFSIPHSEKIEWMIETAGWALECDLEGGHSIVYSIGLVDSRQFPEIVVAGLTPVAAKGLVDLVVEQIDGGVEIPIDVPLEGLFDNGLRCLFSTVEVSLHPNLFKTGRSWRRNSDFAAVQLLWPDRKGFLPYEAGCDAHTCEVQPVLGRVPS